jgi:hypothetical protein
MCRLCEESNQEPPLDLRTPAAPTAQPEPAPAASVFTFVLVFSAEAMAQIGELMKLINPTEPPSLDEVVRRGIGTELFMRRVIRDGSKVMVESPDGTKVEVRLP